MRNVVTLLFMFTAGLALGETNQPPSTSQPTSKVDQVTILIPVQDIGSRVLVVGELGLPIGETVTISGKKGANERVPERFWVESLNGKKMEHPCGILVEGIGKWQDGTRATLKGYEQGTLRFLHLNETNFGLHDSRWKGEHQKLFLRFHVTQVLEPKGLRLERE